MKLYKKYKKRWAKRERRKDKERLLQWQCVAGCEKFKKNKRKSIEIELSTKRTREERKKPVATEIRLISVEASSCC